jgi:hypothetical protein
MNLLDISPGNYRIGAQSLLLLLSLTSSTVLSILSGSAENRQQLKLPLSSQSSPSWTRKTILRH